MWAKVVDRTRVSGHTHTQTNYDQKQPVFWRGGCFLHLVVGHTIVYSVCACVPVIARALRHYGERRRGNAAASERHTGMSTDLSSEHRRCWCRRAERAIEQPVVGAAAVPRRPVPSQAGVPPSLDVRARLRCGDDDGARVVVILLFWAAATLLYSTSGRPSPCTAAARGVRAAARCRPPPASSCAPPPTRRSSRRRPPPPPPSPAATSSTKSRCWAFRGRPTTATPPATTSAPSGTRTLPSRPLPPPPPPPSRFYLNRQLFLKPFLC